MKNFILIILFALFAFSGDILALLGIGIPLEGHILSLSFITQTAGVVLIFGYCMRHLRDSQAFLWIACAAVGSLVILPIELMVGLG
jgi:hypothetical protein